MRGGTWDSNRAESQTSESFPDIYAWQPEIGSENKSAYMYFFRLYVLAMRTLSS